MQIVLHALVTASTTWTGGALISIIIKEKNLSYLQLRHQHHHWALPQANSPEAE